MHSKGTLHEILTMRHVGLNVELSDGFISFILTSYLIKYVTKDDIVFYIFPDFKLVQLIIGFLTHDQEKKILAIYVGTIFYSIFVHPLLIMSTKRVDLMFMKCNSKDQSYLSKKHKLLQLLITFRY